MNILFVYKGSIEFDTASANRVLSLSRSFVSLGVDVTIYNIIPTNRRLTSCVLDGINVFYPRCYNFFPSKITIILGLLYTLPKIFIEKKPRIVYSYGFSFIQTKLLLFYKHFYKFKLVKELNEYPLYFLSDKKYKKILGRVLQLFDNRGLDAIIVITNYLKDYYIKYASKYTHFFILNMIVDLKRFDIPKTNVTELQIVYCGSFNNNKDGILYLIKGYSKFIKATSYKAKLYLIGKGNAVEQQAIMDLINSESLESSVIMLGLTSKEIIPYYLINSSVLVLPRPDSIQAKAGFPTKLGEYLASSNPVIVSNVGEISNFLIDNYSCYFLRDLSDDEVCAKLCNVFDDYNKSRLIGKRGRTVAETYFDSNKEASRLLSFFEKQLL